MQHKKQYPVNTMYYIVKVYLIFVFQHGCTNPAGDSSWKLFFSNNEKTSLTGVLTWDLSYY